MAGIGRNQPYTLTLTSAERKAIDWVGHRYAHGDDLSNVLLSCDWVCMEAEDDWDGPHPLTFLISESDAWAIQQIADDEDHRWDCFARSLVGKMEAFLETIV
ncbi:MAG: hypothetical protein ACYS7Y_25265 [Planctomycetota bacterium]|jgi:hypothetical protein